MTSGCLAVVAWESGHITGDIVTITVRGTTAAITNSKAATSLSLLCEAVRGDFVSRPAVV